MKREEKKAQTHQKITEAAIELFEQQGYETTTVQQIAERAAVAKGTFFNYFASKEDLVMELQGQVILQQFEFVLGTPGPIIPRLLSLMADHARHFPLNQSATRALLQGMFSSSKVRSYQAACCLELSKSFVPILAHAQKQGEIRQDLSVEVISQLAVQTYFGVLMNWCLEDGKGSLSDQMSLTFDLFIHGIHPTR